MTYLLLKCVLFENKRDEDFEIHNCSKTNGRKVLRFIKAPKQIG